MTIYAGAVPTFPASPIFLAGCASTKERQATSGGQPPASVTAQQQPVAAAPATPFTQEPSVTCADWVEASNGRVDFAVTLIGDPPTVATAGGDQSTVTVGQEDWCEGPDHAATVRENVGHARICPWGDTAEVRV